MENKRIMGVYGQVTIFIIIAILIIAAVALFFIFREKVGITKEKPVSPEIATIKNFVEGCIKETSEDGIILVGIQGGYFNLPREHLVLENSEIAYAYYNGKNTLTPISNMENEINSYIKNSLPFCFELGNFSGFNITEGKIKAESTINKDEILLKVNYPLTIKKGKSTSILDEKYNEEIFVRLGDMHFITQKIINEKLNSNFMDLTYLSELGYSISIFPQDNNVFIYSIKDENYELGGMPYTFNFAVKK